MMMRISSLMAATTMVVGVASAECVQGYALQENGKAMIEVRACGETDNEVRFDHNPAVGAAEGLSRDSFAAGEKSIELSYGDKIVATELKMFSDRGRNKVLRVSVPDADQAKGLGEATLAGETVTAELITASTGIRETLYSGVLTVD